MTYVLNALIHISVLTGLVLFIREAFLLIADAPNRTERNMRLLALSLGFLIFLGARAVGLDVPDLIAASLSNITPVRLAVAGVVLPSSIGVLTAWFLLHGIQQRGTHERLVRLSVLLTTFTAVLFADVYAELSTKPSANGQINTHLLPNLAFFIGVSLYVLLRTPTLRTASGSKWEDGL